MRQGSPRVLAQRRYERLVHSKPLGGRRRAVLRRALSCVHEGAHGSGERLRSKLERVLAGCRSHKRVCPAPQQKLDHLVISCANVHCKHRLVHLCRRRVSRHAQHNGLRVDVCAALQQQVRHWAVEGGEVEWERVRREWPVPHRRVDGRASFGNVAQRRLDLVWIPADARDVQGRQRILDHLGCLSNSVRQHYLEQTLEHSHDTATFCYCNFFLLQLFATVTFCYCDFLLLQLLLLQLWLL